MGKNKNEDFIKLLQNLMLQRKISPTQLASELGVKHSTISRWLNNKATPSVSSCKKLAELAEIPPERVFASVGYLPRHISSISAVLPEFCEYATLKYKEELDEDIITVIEDLIERRRARINILRKDR